jgi:multiple sugar transport system permease protein
MSKQRTRESIEAYLFVAPLLIGLALFAVFPMVASMAMSFCRYDFTQQRLVGGQ